MKRFKANTLFLTFVLSFSMTVEASEINLGQFNFFTSMCYSYSETEPTSGETFKCRRYGESLYVDGVIEGVMLDELSFWGLSGYTFPGQRPLKKLHLNSKGGVMFSHGGASATAVDIIEFIKEKKIETYARAECKSACVPIFVAGLKRKAFRTSDFMVHSPRLGGLFLLSLKKKCGELLDNPLCKKEIEEMRAVQIVEMDKYFDLLEREGVLTNLRRDYLSGEKDLKAPLNGNFIGIEDLYFDGQKALEYGVALELI